VSASSAKILAAIALVATFVVGAIVGLVADRALVMHGFGVPHPSTEFLVRRLDRRLHFTSQQRAQVVIIIDRHQQSIAKIWQGVRPSVHAEIESASSEIDRLLTPEQRVKFDKIRPRLVPRNDGGGMRVRHD
jgi:hypothetical protein